MHIRPVLTGCLRECKGGGRSTTRQAPVSAWQAIGLRVQGMQERAVRGCASTPSIKALPHARDVTSAVRTAGSQRQMPSPGTPKHQMKKSTWAAPGCTHAQGSR